MGKDYMRREDKGLIISAAKHSDRIFLTEEVEDVQLRRELG